MDGQKNKKALFVSIPHSGEKIPEDCIWLKSLPEPVLMCDVDRYVDRLYEPSLDVLEIPYVKTDWHRFAADLNRLPEDIDCDSVQGNSNKSGSFARGFHWVLTTKNEKIMGSPMSKNLHEKLVQLIYEPFHQSVRKQYENFKAQGFAKVFHIDAHSMPSLGTDQHRDPGEYRAEIVVSDCKGTSCSPDFVNLVIASYAKAGFKVAYNWPYFGGRVTEQYGHPSKGMEALQVELNRALYMDEVSKKYLPEKAVQVQKQIQIALEMIKAAL